MGETTLCSIATQQQGSQVGIMKNISNELVQGNLKQLLEYMLNPEGDSFNPALNEDERQVADEITGWVYQANTQDNANLQVFGIDKDKNSDHGPYDLRKTVADIAAEFSYIGTEEANGVSQDYRRIDFLVRLITDGGKYGPRHLDYNGPIKAAKEAALYKISK